MPSRILRLWNPDAGAWEEVGDSRLSAHLAAGDPHPQYLTAGEVPPSDVTVTTDASLTSTESPANTFALAVRLSPDAGNALALRGNGLYGTDTTGGGGGGLATDPLADAKGDLFAASGADAVGRLALGTDGHVLTADSTQSLGVRWAAVAGSYLPLAGGTLTGALVLQGAATNTVVLEAKAAADTQPRFRSDARGLLSWGPGGSTAPDSTLERIGSNHLQLKAQLSPTPHNTYDLGVNATRWRKVYAVDGDFSGILSVPATAHIRTSTSEASTGSIRMGYAQLIAWRNAANNANLALTVDASNQLTFNGVPLGAGGSYLPLAGGELTGDLTVSEATPTVALKQAADTQARAQLTDTALSFGPGGTTAPDTTLARTGAGALRVDNHLGVGVNPAAWHPDRRATQVGVTAAVVGHPTGSHLELVENSYLDSGATQRAVVTGAASRLNLGGGGWTFQNAPSVAAGAIQTFTTRAVLNTTGTLTLTPDAGQLGLRLSGSAAGLSHDNGGPFTIAAEGQNIILDPHAQYCVPSVDNNKYLGSGALRWAAVYAVNGTIQTSSLDAKQDITPLDPTACAQAVLDTDWVSFEYTAPPLGQGPPGETVAQSTARVKAHSKSVQETAAARKQRGFVLGSPQHRVSDLFGLEDRKSTSPSSDLAVVAAALQNVIQRLQALEGAAA